MQTVIKAHLRDIPYTLYLYGSRVHDHLKGGDIDLLLVTNEAGVSLFRKVHLDLLVQLKKQPTIGQRKIDFKVARSEDLARDPFLKAISQSMVELKSPRP
jgi:hypothetical protein